jgi:hypothetical protein
MATFKGVKRATSSFTGSWGPRDGFTISGVEECAASDLTTVIANLQSYGYALEWAPANGRTGPVFHVKWTRPASAGGFQISGYDQFPVPAPADIFSDTWVVAYNEEQIDLLADPDVLNDLNTKVQDPDKRALLIQDIQNYISGNRVITGYDPKTGQASGQQTLLTFQELSYLIIDLGLNWPTLWFPLLSDLSNGITTRLYSLPVLRRSLLLPPNTSLAPAFENINMFYSTPGLLAYETTIPKNISGNLPAGYWLRKAPTAEQRADGRWDYHVEYWWTKYLGNLNAQRLVA